jgi:hypothetical protein
VFVRANYCRILFCGVGIPLAAGLDFKMIPTKKADGKWDIPQAFILARARPGFLMRIALCDVPECTNWRTDYTPMSASQGADIFNDDSFDRMQAAFEPYGWLFGRDSRNDGMAICPECRGRGHKPPHSLTRARRFYVNEIKTED